MQGKEQLRRFYRSRREVCSRDERTRASAAVCRHLEECTALAPWRHFAGYAAFRNEIDVSSFLANKLCTGSAVYLPRVVSPAHLEFVEVHHLDLPERSGWGIPEPQGEAAELSKIEVFIVPGLAFDREGGRLGFGKGFYDRILHERCASLTERESSLGRSEMPGSGGRKFLTIGVCYHWQVSDELLPVEEHDVPIDMIATDREMIVCSDRIASHY